MNGKLIHIRGCMASGKTSTARSFIARGNYSVEFITIDKKQYPYTIDKRQQRVVTGRYDQCVCGGLDGSITNKNLMKVYLYKIMKEVHPKVIVTEAVMYGITFKFGKELSDLCASNGYEYRGVLIQPPIEKVFDNMAKRNGGKPINFDNLATTYFSSERASAKLRAEGISCDVVDSSKYRLEDLYQIIEEQI